MAEYLHTVSDKKLRSTLTRYRLSGHKLMYRDGQTQTTWLPPEQRLCSHCDLNQMETELHFNRVLPIHRYMDSVLQQIHPTLNSSDQEKLAYLLGEHKTCCVFCWSICVSLSHRRETLRLPELMFPAHVEYIMTYTPLYYLNYICLCKSYTVLYLIILFLSHTYNSHSFCTTIIRFKYLFYYYIIFLFLSVNSNVHYLWAAQLQLLWQYKCIVFVMPIKHT